VFIRYRARNRFVFSKEQRQIFQIIIDDAKLNYYSGWNCFRKKGGIKKYNRSNDQLPLFQVRIKKYNNKYYVQYSSRTRLILYGTIWITEGWKQVVITKKERGGWR
jgi:hypothetical protein